MRKLIGVLAVFLLLTGCEMGNYQSADDCSHSSFKALDTLSASADTAAEYKEGVAKIVKEEYVCIHGSIPSFAVARGQFRADSRDT